MDQTRPDGGHAQGTLDRPLRRASIGLGAGPVPHFDMTEVYSCMVDTRGDRPRLFAGASSPWTGPQIQVSDDLGETWRPDRRRPLPRRPRHLGRAGLAAGAGRRDGVVYAGTEPGAVFRSTDGGETFSSSGRCGTTRTGAQWGAGFGGQAFHTILPHPDDAASVTVAISTGGVLPDRRRRRLAGQPRNRGVRADFLPGGRAATPSSASACTR